VSQRRSVASHQLHDDRRSGTGGWAALNASIATSSRHAVHARASGHRTVARWLLLGHVSYEPVDRLNTSLVGHLHVDRQRGHGL
jgi:hypothetical protein